MTCRNYIPGPRDCMHGVRKSDHCWQCTRMAKELLNDDFSDHKAPDLSHLSTDDLCQLLLITGLSDHPTDKTFAKACRDEISKRKP